MAYSPTKISALAAGVVPFENAHPTMTKWVSPGASGNGTASSPYGSIQAAVNASVPGTAIMVKAGTYTENVKLTKSGTATAPIWLASADGEGSATIKAAASGTSTVYGHGVDNIVIQGFRLTGSTEGTNITQAGTNLTNMATNIVIEDNIVYGHTNDGIKTSQTVNSAIVGNTVYNIASQEGIDNVYMRNGVIADNTVYNVRGLSGIVAKAGSENVRIIDNTVSDVRDGILVGGQSSGQGSTFPNGIAYEAKSFTVSGNTVSGTQKAITVYGAHDSVVRDNALKTGGTWVATVGADNLGYVSKGMQFIDNDVSKSNWLSAAAGSVSVNTGNTLPGASAPAPSKTIPVDSRLHDWKDSGAATKTIKGTTAADTLTGTIGNDHIDGGSGIDKMSGGSGDDRYVASSRYDAVMEASSAGRDTVFLWDASYTLPANVENMVIYRSAGAVVRDNGLNNILTGGIGADMFTFAASHGHDLIRGLKLGTDHIKIDSTAISAMTVAQNSAGDMVVQHGAHSITLVGVDPHTGLATLF